MQQQTIGIINSITEIKMSLKSGTMTIWRGSGDSVEEGSIEFRQGQIVDAKLGHRRGTDAVNLLTTWRQCRFQFGNPEFPRAWEENSPFVAPNFYKEVHTESYPSLSGLQAKSINALSPTYASSKGAAAWHIPEVTYVARQLEHGLLMIDDQGLSRSHKRLFLLIDGKRSIQDLVRLLKRSPEDIYKQLYDLERAGIIKVPAHSKVTQQG